MDCTIYLAITKALISCADTLQLICTFVLAYAKSRFCHDVGQLIISPLKHKFKVLIRSVELSRVASNVFPDMEKTRNSPLSMNTLLQSRTKSISTKLISHRLKCIFMFTRSSVLCGL